MGNKDQEVVSSFLHTNKLEALFNGLKNGDVIPFLCSGTSMKPTLINGVSIVYLKKGIPDIVNRGDIIFFYRRQGKPVLHRVLKIKETNNKQTFIMNGDSQDWTEEIEENQIIAKVIGVRRKGIQSNYVSNTSFKFRVWANTWMFLRPIRSLVIKLFRFIKY